MLWMKWAVLFAVIVVATIIVNGQEKRAQSNPDQKDSQSENSSPSPTANSVTAVNQQTTTQQENRPEQHSQSYFCRLFYPANLPNDGLFIVGVIGIIVAICTLLDVKKQTENARLAAEAAKLNAEAVIKAERPWIIGVEGENSFRIFRNPATIPKFCLAIKNSGRTPGKLIRVLMKFELRDSLDGLRGIEHDLDITDICPLPYVLIIPEAMPFQISATMKVERTLTQAEMDDIRDSRRFLAAYGVIEYEDVFGLLDREHKTGFFFYYVYGGPGHHGFQMYYSAPPDYLQTT